MCFKTFRNEPGGRAMTREEEDILANGRNYEHSRGSVQQSKLEQLFRVRTLYDRSKAMLIKMGKPVSSKFTAILAQNLTIFKSDLPY